MSFDHISSLISKKIKTADNNFQSGTASVEWANLRRAPQILKKKANIGVNTKDEEYDHLKARLCQAEKTLVDVQKYSQMMSTGVEDLLSTFDLVAANLAVLFLSDSSLPHEASHSPIVKAALEGNTLEQCRSAVLQATADLNMKIETRVAQALQYFKYVQKHTRAREGALLDYDQTLNSRQSLISKKTIAELSVKQSQHLFSLERKLAENKMKYTEVNDQLKSELPLYLNLFLGLLGELQVYVLKSHHYIFRQVQIALGPLLLSLGGSVYVSNSQFVRDIGSRLEETSQKCSQDFARLRIFSQKATNEMLPEKHIVQISPRLCPSQSCKAIFSYKAQQAGDLSFAKDDLITILESNGNWWKGSLRGECGIFPANYVELNP